MVRLVHYFSLQTIRLTRRPNYTTLDDIVEPGIIDAFNPRYPDTPLSGRMHALYETQREDIPQVCILFATDAREQPLYNAILKGEVLAGRREEGISV